MPTSAVDEQLSQLIQISWILLIPVGALLGLVLIKLLSILQGAQEFLTLARYEVYPLLKDARQVLSRVEVMSEKAQNSVDTVEKGVVAAGKGIGKIRDASGAVSSSIPGLLGGLASATMKTIFRKK